MNLNLTLIAQAVSFALFIWFTVKFVWPPMLRAIEARQKSIADGLAAAEQGRRSLETSTRQADEAVRAARARAAEILAQAEKRAAQLVDEARNAAKEEATARRPPPRPRSSRPSRVRATSCAIASPRSPSPARKRSCAARSTRKRTASCWNRSSGKCNGRAEHR